MITYTISVVYNLYTTQYKGQICINPIINLWPKWTEMIKSSTSQKAEHYCFSFQYLRFGSIPFIYVLAWSSGKPWATICGIQVLIKSSMLS